MRTELNRLFFELQNYLKLIQSREILGKNADFRNIHEGKRCFVIGNGPSLSKQNLTPLKKEITFVMSGFWKHRVISTRWQPTYYCFADSLFFDESRPMADFFKSLNRKILTSRFFVPIYAKAIIEKDRLLPINRTNFVLFGQSLAKVLSLDINLTGIIPSVQSTAQLAIETAIYMGCNPIYLLGLDHDWLAHRGMDKHFYEGKTIDNHPVAHGDLSRLSYKVDLLSALNLWQGYETLKKIARKKNIKIYNATNGGFLDVFNRINYDDI